jgi:hypothetical protein
MDMGHSQVDRGRSPFQVRSEGPLQRPLERSWFQGGTSQMAQETA